MVIGKEKLKLSATNLPLPLWLPQIPHGVHWPVTAAARSEPLSDAITEVHNSRSKTHVLYCVLF